MRGPWCTYNFKSGPPLYFRHTSLQFITLSGIGESAIDKDKIIHFDVAVNSRGYVSGIMFAVQLNDTKITVSMSCRFLPWKVLKSVLIHLRGTIQSAEIDIKFIA